MEALQICHKSESHKQIRRTKEFISNETSSKVDLFHCRFCRLVCSLTSVIKCSLWSFSKCFIRCTPNQKAALKASCRENETVRAILQTKRDYFSVFLFPEAGPGPSLHRVLPEGLYLQRDPAGLRETAQLPAQRGPHLHLPGGPEMWLWRVSDQHHWMYNICVTHLDGQKTLIMKHVWYY